jgi:adenylate cyclase
MLPAERREITVAFFDLAGFSSTAERLGDDAVTPFVNHAMRTIAAEVRASGGYVNKFLGDGLLALWNAPAPLEEHATAALCAAVRVRHALGERRPNAEHGGDGDAAPTAAAPVGEHANAGLERSPVRVGVATGEALVGDFGAPPELMDYTAIGRVVNDAAHLEQAAKSFGAWCLLSAADGSFNPLGPISEELRDVAFTRPVGPVLLRGRRTPRSVFELLTPSASRDAAWCIALAQATREAVDAVDEGHIVDARQRFASIVERFDDPVAKAWMAALGDIDDPARVMLTVNR